MDSKMDKGHRPLTSEDLQRLLYEDGAAWQPKPRPVTPPTVAKPTKIVQSLDAALDDTIERVADDSHQLGSVVANMTASQIESFWGHIDRSGGDNACWEWNGSLIYGYGEVKWKRKRYRAHRIAYTLVRGDITADTHLHHECNNRRCCNPWHLKAVTLVEHMTMHGRIRQAQKTHCPQGHPYDTVNSRGWRSCSICQTEYNANRKEHYRAWASQWRASNRERDRERKREWARKQAATKRNSYIE